MMLEDESTSSEGDQFSEDLQHLPELPPKKDVFIIGDWDAKVGSQEIPKIRLTEFCQKHTLVIASTFFQQHKR